MSTTEDGPDTDDDEDVFVTCEALGVAPYPDLTVTVDGCVYYQQLCLRRVKIKTLHVRNILLIIFKLQ